MAKVWVDQVPAVRRPPVELPVERSAVIVAFAGSPLPDYLRRNNFISVFKVLRSVTTNLLLERSLRIR